MKTWLWAHLLLKVRHHAAVHALPSHAAVHPTKALVPTAHHRRHLLLLKVHRGRVMLRRVLVRWIVLCLRRVVV